MLQISEKKSHKNKTHPKVFKQKDGKNCYEKENFC